MGLQMIYLYIFLSIVLLITLSLLHRIKSGAVYIDSFSFQIAEGLGGALTVAIMIIPFTSDEISWGFVFLPIALQGFIMFLYSKNR